MPLVPLVPLLPFTSTFSSPFAKVWSRLAMPFPVPFCFAPKLLKGADECVLLCPLLCPLPSQCFKERKSEESIEGMTVTFGEREDIRAWKMCDDKRETIWELQQYYQHRGAPCKATALGIWN